MFDDMPLFNTPTVPHNGVDTSMDAAESIRPSVNAMAKQVLECIRANPNGMTCDEVELRLKMKHQTCSARIRDLSSCQPPFIVTRTDDKGKPIRRKTSSGRTARVYFAHG